MEHLILVGFVVFAFLVGVLVGAGCFVAMGWLLPRLSFSYRRPVVLAPSQEDNELPFQSYTDEEAIALEAERRNRARDKVESLGEGF